MTSEIIRHTFEDFFDFHLHLLGHFPAEAGVVAPSNTSDGKVATKIIPDLPCQKIFVSYDTAKVRVPQLQAYMEVIGNFIMHMFGDFVHLNLRLCTIGNHCSPSKSLKVAFGA